MHFAGRDSVGETGRHERAGTHADVHIQVSQRHPSQRLLQRDQRADLIDGAKGTAPRESDPHLPVAPPVHPITPRAQTPLVPSERFRRTYSAAFALCARPWPCVSSSSASFLVITVRSWTRFDKTSISLWVGTFKACSARPTRSSNTLSSLFQVPVTFSLTSSAATLVRS